MFEPNIKLLHMRIDVACCWRTGGRRSMAEKQEGKYSTQEKTSLKNRKDSGRFGNTSKDTLLHNAEKLCSLQQMGN